MKNQRISTVLLLMMILVPLAFIRPTVAEENEYKTWEFTEGGLNIQCYVPIEAYAGDTLTIKIRIEVSETVTDFYFWMRLYGTTGFNELVNDYDMWNSEELTLYFSELSSGVIRNEQFEVITSSDLQPGMLWGWFTIAWYKDGWHYIPPWIGYLPFTVAYLKNKAYEDLQKAYEDLLNDYNDLLADYESLNSTYYSLLSEYSELQANYTNAKSDRDYWMEQANYWESEYDDKMIEYDSLQTDYTGLQNDYNSLQASYTSLQSNHDALQTVYDSLNSTYNTLQSEYESLQSKHDVSTANLDTTRNLSYIFVITTGVFIVTAVYFAVRKPKVKTT